jgi:DNA-binding CsgD family transcriptional regulator
MALPARAYRRILDLTLAVLDSHALQAAWDLVLAELVTTLSGEVGWMYEDVNFERSTGRPCAWSPAVEGRHQLEPMLRAHMPVHPLARHLAATGDPTPRTVNELIGERAWRNNSARSSLRASFGVTRQIVLAIPAAPALPDGPPGWRSCLVSRSGSDFALGERNFARQAQPVLARLDRHVTELDRLRQLSAGNLPGPEARAADVGLTPRELTVLALLAQGLTAQSLARRLGISTRTAVKHLEHIYRKCGTSDRLSTVLLAQDLGLVPRDTGLPPKSPA